MMLLLCLSSWDTCSNSSADWVYHTDNPYKNNRVKAPNLTSYHKAFAKYNEKDSCKEEPFKAEADA